ncbi:MAG: nuclear transport factor 2 family protein [Pseudomonadota bacterium]
MLLDDLKECETRVWQALTRGDAAADAAHLDPTFLGVYPSGFAGKADHVGQLAEGPTVARFQLSHLRWMSLGDDHALISYRAVFRRTGASADEAMYVSSIWRRTEAGWVNVFSQDTRAEAGPPAI